MTPGAESDGRFAYKVIVAEHSKRGRAAIAIPSEVDDATVEVDGRRVALTNLRKIYFPALGLNEG